MEASASLRDFPDALNPVFVRDLRQGLRSQVFAGSFLALQLFALLFAVAELLTSTFAGEAAAVTGGVFQFGLAVAFGFLLPLTSFGALRPELGPGRNVELLLAAGLTRWQLTFGKLAVPAALNGLLLVSLLPYLLLRYFIGGVELIETLGFALSAYLGGLVMHAIFIGASGFANYVGRALSILFLAIVYHVCLGLASAGWTAPIGGGMGNFGLGIVPAAVASVLFAVLGLQLGRSRAKAFADRADPPAAAVVFLIAFAAPFLAGLALAAGGPLLALAVVVVLLILTLLLDRGPDAKKGLKKARPSRP